MSKTVVSMLSELEILGFLKTNGTQCRFVSMTIRTPVVKIRTGNPFGQVVKSGKVVGESKLDKVATVSGLINANYVEAVRRRLAEKLGVEIKEVEYTGGPSVYLHLLTGEGKPLPVLVKASNPTDGVYYLQYFPHKSTSVYVNAQGEVVDKETVKPWLHAVSERPDYKPQVQSVKLANIRRLKASGIVLEMPDLDEADAALAAAE